MVFARLLNADTVVGKRLGRVVVENEQQPGTFKNDDLVNFVLEGYVGLWSGKPPVSLFGIVHSRVELVQILVAEKLVVDDVPLSSCVLE